MGKVNEFYMKELEPLKLCRVKVGNLWRHVNRTFRKGESEVTVLLEYDADDSKGKCRSWVGIYYGIMHSRDKTGLSKEEKELLQGYFLRSYWLQLHQNNSNNASKIFMDGEDGESDVWDFWIRHREDDSIYDSLSAINILIEGLKIIGYQEVNN